VKVAKAEKTTWIAYGVSLSALQSVFSSQAPNRGRFND